MLQLAFGWTKLSILAGLISISILVPLMFPMTKYFGLVGAAAIWAILNTLNLLVAVPIMHRRLLPSETWRYFSDIGLPLLGSIATVMIGRLVFVVAKIESPGATFAVLAGVWLVGSTAAILAAPHIREAVRRYFSKLSPSYV
jgi:O-antigen/teichoic acid export membrane protein